MFETSRWKCPFQGSIILVFVVVDSTVRDCRHQIEEGVLERFERVGRLAEDCGQFDQDEEADSAEVGEVVAVADDGEDEGGEEAQLSRDGGLQDFVFKRLPRATDQPVDGDYQKILSYPLIIEKTFCTILLYHGIRSSNSHYLTLVRYI